ncbi:unnamed protein product [Ostreobium quekettii]|uniref:Transmembrane protein n=1 Tax=Ostreobium quekettii TaxID=121088 RepID=A0A8S1JF75_9CHLO|nr:unnamed protein product [Ostreobium quekettii]|eukprot:evm.model.scf_1345.1 EVM.evm.TU.scf_1345.1   scf_1345:2213-4123(-)
MQGASTNKLSVAGAVVVVDCMAGWAEDIVFGALTSGVNKPTFVCLNIVLLLCVVTLGATLLLSIAAYPFLVPHLAFLLMLALGLWALIIWFVCNLGMTTSEQQRKELDAGTSEGPHQNDKKAE